MIPTTMPQYSVAPARRQRCGVASALQSSYRDYVTKSLKKPKRAEFARNSEICRFALAAPHYAFSSFLKAWASLTFSSAASSVIC